MNNQSGLVRRPVAGIFGDFDSLVDSFFLPLREAGVKPGASLVPAMDVVEKDDRYEVEVELPGVKKEDVNISLQEGVLTINAGNRREKTEERDGRVISRELRRGEFVRSLRFGSAIEESGIDAGFSDGILHIRLPKAQEAQPRRIEVRAG